MSSHAKLISLTTTLVLTGGLVFGLISAQKASDPSLEEYQAKLERAFDGASEHSARAMLDLGVASMRMGHYQDAERSFRSAIRIDPALLKRYRTPVLARSSFDYLESQMGQAEPSAIFCAGVYALLSNDPDTARITLMLYALTLGGDADVDRLLGKDVNRALLRSDVRARSSRWDAARAELGLAEANGESALGVQGRLAAMALANGQWKDAERSLQIFLSLMPASSTFYAELPALDGPWWKRQKMLGLNFDEPSDSLLAFVVWLALTERRQEANQVLERIPDAILDASERRSLAAFIARAATLPPLEVVDKREPSEIDRVLKAFQEERFVDAANLAATQIGAGEGASFTPIFVASTLLAEMAKNDASKLTKLSKLLLDWGNEHQDHHALRFHGLLSEATRKKLQSWIRAKDLLDPNAYHLGLLLACDAENLDAKRLTSAFKAGLIPPHWLPEGLIEKPKPLPIANPALAEDSIRRGNDAFREGRYAEAWKLYLEAAHHDAEHKELTAALMRGALGQKDYAKAANYLLKMLHESGLSDTKSAERYQIGLLGRVDRTLISRWGNQALAYANSVPTHNAPILLVAMLRYEIREWKMARSRLLEFRDTSTDSDSDPKAIKFLILAATKNVKE